VEDGGGLYEGSQTRARVRACGGSLRHPPPSYTAPTGSPSSLRHHLSTAQHGSAYFKRTMGSFGSGLEPTPRRLVESCLMVAAPPFGAVARVALQIDGAVQQVEVEHQERRLGGSQAYWRCPRCGALRSHLYVVDGVLACRVCHGLDYRSRHVPQAVARAAKLRRRLGGAPGLLGPLPRKPRHWRPDYYRRLIAELIAAERVIARMLHGTVAALERRKGRLRRGREQRS